METSENKYLKARERVKELREFYNHLFSYILVNILLAGLNYYTNQWAYPWFLWVVGGWGIGLAFDALKVFLMNPMFGKRWEERKIMEYMEKEEKQRWE
ncbi:MAG TPA: 2TM domain-containing protein [Salegentibacter sp.]|nr:2TM domain-containing protein [Salegentibacter sp.]